MPLTDADFALRFDMGDVYVWIECNRETCYAYLDGRDTGLRGDGWLFNLIDPPEEFRPLREEPPILDRARSLPFDLDGEVDPEGFLVTGGEFEGQRAYEVWYSDQLVGVLRSERGRSESAYALAPSGLVRPLDRKGALARHFARTAYHMGNALDVDADRLPAEVVQAAREYLRHNELGLVADEIRPFEGMLSPEALAEMERTRLHRGERAT